VVAAADSQIWVAAKKTGALNKGSSLILQLWKIIFLSPRQLAGMGAKKNFFLYALKTVTDLK
jgi:hypothetical protein